jgi:hypothetical protein
MKYTLVLIALISGQVSAALPASGFKWKLEDNRIKIEKPSEEYILHVDCRVTPKNSLQVETNYKTLRKNTSIRVNKQKCLIEEIERIA